jgi:hypothetical protein
MLIVPQDHWPDCRSERDYRARVAARASRAGRSLVVDARPLHVIVNAGKWMALCPHCNAGITIHPEWGFAACLGKGCYRVYSDIRVPANWMDIESALEVRPQQRQHWLCGAVRTRFYGKGGEQLPSETVEELLAENERHREEVGGRDLVIGEPVEEARS